MKKRLWSGGFLSLLLFALISCSDEEGKDITLFSGTTPDNETPLTTVTLYLNGNASMTVGITGGNANYAVQSSDTSIVVASMQDGRICLSARRKGQASVTARDSQGHNCVLQVTAAYGGYGMEVAKKDFFVWKDGQYIHDSLVDFVEAVMQPYADACFKDDDAVVFQPDTLKIFPSGAGSFTFLRKEHDEIVGRYQKIAEQKTMEFIYKDWNGKQATHTFLISLPTIASRDVGPVTLHLFEEVPAEVYGEYLKDLPDWITFPKDARLYLGITIAGRAYPIAL